MIEKELREKLEQKGFRIIERKLPKNLLTLINSISEKQKFYEDIHHSLDEFYIYFFQLYPFLNLNELFALALGIRERTNSRNVSSNINYFIDQGKINLEGLLNESKIDSCNPYSNSKNKIDSFQNRIKIFYYLFPEFENKFRNALSQEPTIYVFACNYEREKALRGDNYRLKIMNFMPVYPKNKEEHIKLYSKEIVRILKSFPQFYIWQEDFLLQLSFNFKK
ncbi:MAG: hypothetical protein QW622_01395 [Candidatus Pacearchaeota archaeon]